MRVMGVYLRVERRDEARPCPLCEGGEQAGREGQRRLVAAEAGQRVHQRRQAPGRELEGSQAQGRTRPTRGGGGQNLMGLVPPQHTNTLTHTHTWSDSLCALLSSEGSSRAEGPFTPARHAWHMHNT
jgi:hypothetical protein